MLNKWIMHKNNMEYELHIKCLHLEHKTLWWFVLRKICFKYKLLFLSFFLFYYRSMNCNVCIYEYHEYVKANTLKIIDLYFIIVQINHRLHFGMFSVRLIISLKFLFLSLRFFFLSISLSLSRAWDNVCVCSGSLRFISASKVLFPFVVNAKIMYCHHITMKKREFWRHFTSFNRIFCSLFSVIWFSWIRLYVISISELKKITRNSKACGLNFNIHIQLMG